MLDHQETQEFIIRIWGYRHFIDSKVGRGSLLIDDRNIFGRVLPEGSILWSGDGFGSVSSVADEVFGQPF